MFVSVSFLGFGREGEGVGSEQEKIICDVAVKQEVKKGKKRGRDKDKVD